MERIEEERKCYMKFGNGGHEAFFQARPTPDATMYAEGGFMEKNK